MRYYSVSVLTLFILLFSSCGSGDGSGSSLREDAPDVKLYTLKNVKIEYEYSGAASGKRIHQIANYGMYQRIDDDFTYNLAGTERKVNTIDIITDTVQYHIDNSKSTGTRNSFDPTQLRNLIKDYTPEEIEDFQTSYLLKSGAKAIGKETILDRECTVYDLTASHVIVSMWRGITLRSQTKLGESEIIVTAVGIDDSYSPDAAQFTPPKNVKIEEPGIISNFPEGHPPVDAPSDGELPEGHPPVGNP